MSSLLCRFSDTKRNCKDAIKRDLTVYCYRKAQKKKELDDRLKKREEQKQIKPATSVSPKPKKKVVELVAPA